MFNMLRSGVLGTVTVGLLATAQCAHASGYYVREQGAQLQGHAFAGASAKADDLSTIYFNPAGLVRLDAGRMGQASANLIKPSLKFTSTSAASAQVTAAGRPAATAPSTTDGDGGDGGSLALVPNAYIALATNENMKFGMGINAPFGLTIEYDDDWVGRYHAQKSALLSVNLNPVVSYRVNDKLSIGGGPVVQYLSGELTSAINVGALTAAGLAQAGGTNIANIPAATASPDGKSVLTAKDFGFGLALGVLYEFNDHSRIGASYRSRIKHTLDGDIDIRGVSDTLAASSNGALVDRDASAKISTPDILAVGFRHGINDKLAILGEVTWTNWSVFDELRVLNTDGTTAQLTTQNWHDTYFVSVGAEYKYNEAMTLQFGLAHDQSPIRQADINFRIPDNNSTWFAAGVKYDLGDTMLFSAGYTYVMADDFTVTETESVSTATPPTPSFNGTVSGEYEAKVHILALDFKMSF